MKSADGVHRNAARGPVYTSPSVNTGAQPSHGGGHSGNHGGGHHYDSHNHRHSSISVGIFAGGGAWGFGLGYSESRYHHYSHSYSSVSYSYGFGGGPWYSYSSYHSAAYAPCWNYHYYGWVPAYGVVAVGPVYGPTYVEYVSFRRHARYHFGYSYYYPFAVYSPYPFYRTVCYEPYYLTSYSVVCPTYRTYYYTQRRSTVTYVETTDPYVEPEEVPTYEEILVEPEPVVISDDLVGSSGVVTVGDDALIDGPDVAIPVEFASPFVAGFPEGLSFDDLLAWGEEALANAEYLSSAEAFRRAAVERWNDDYPKFQMALALFGAARFDLATQSLELGLDLNPAWLARRFSIVNAFSSADEFSARLRDLERHVIKSDSDEARLLLGYVYLFSDNLFGARSVLQTIRDRGFESRHLSPMAEEADRRLTQKR